MTHVANVTISAAQVSADHTNFPVYIDLSDMPAGFWSTVANGGGDIRVFASDGTTERAREVVSCDTAADTGELHVLVPFLSSSSDTVLQIHADGSSADYAVGETYGRNAVWADYKNVWHMQESSGSTAADSTGTFDGTYAGDLPIKASTYGQSLNGNDYATLNGLDLSDIASGFTVQARINPTDTAAEKSIFSPDNSGTGVERVFQFRVDADETIRFVRFSSGGTLVANFAGSTTVTGNASVAATFNTTAGSVIYVNGSSDATDGNAAGNNVRASNTTALGVRYVSPSFNRDPYVGDLGGVRLRLGALSADWLADEYTNQNTPTTFYTAAAVSASTAITPYGAHLISRQFATIAAARLGGVLQ